MASVTPTAVRLLRSDPFAALVQALETFDETSQTAAPAGILSERVVVPRAPRLGADTPQDALAICLDTRGRVDLGEIARLLGTAPRRRARAARRARLRRPGRAAAGARGRVPVRERPRQARPRPPSRERAAGARGERAGAGAGAAGGPDRGGDRAEVGGGVDRRRHPPPVPRRDPRRPRHPGRASRRGDVGGQRTIVERAGDQRVGNRPDARPRARQGRLGAAADPGHRRDRRRPPRGQPDRDRRRPRESPGAAGALRRVVLGGPRLAPGGSPASTTGGSTRSCCATTAPRASGSPSPASRAPSPRARISAPRSRGCSPSPPSGSSIRSAPARPPRW